MWMRTFKLTFLYDAARDRSGLGSYVFRCPCSKMYASGTLWWWFRETSCHCEICCRCDFDFFFFFLPLHHTLSPLPGVLRTAVPDMDRETRDEYLVVLQAKDMGGHLGGLSGTTTITVKLTDVNDNPPHFRRSECCCYQITLLLAALTFL